jgi:heme exporter protein A
MLGVQYGGADAVLERVGLTNAADDRVRGFSAGMQRRLAIARLVLRNPKFLLLDEPYSNLDSEGVDLVNSIVVDVVRSGGAALIALHELAPARQTLQRSLTILDGRIAGVPFSNVASNVPALFPVTR